MIVIIRICTEKWHKKHLEKLPDYNSDNNNSIDDNLSLKGSIFTSYHLLSIELNKTYPLKMATTYWSSRE